MEKLGDLLSKFFSIKFLSNIVCSDGQLKIADLIKFDVYVKKSCNAQREVGSKTKELLTSIYSLENKKFEEGPTTSIYAECVKHLLANLPLNNQALIELRT